jgi:hypothetical protein
VTILIIAAVIGAVVLAMRSLAPGGPSRHSAFYGLPDDVCSVGTCDCGARALGKVQHGGRITYYHDDGTVACGVNDG